MRFRGLDLNLLVALDALLREQNVSVAAQRLNVSQSTMSGALARLRDYFDDPLLARAGGRFALTPRAEALVEPLHTALTHIEDHVTKLPTFDPATSTRDFTLACSDYLLMVLAAPALRELAREAPHVTFKLRPMSDRVMEQFEQGEIDLGLFGQQRISADHPARFIFEDDYVAVTSSDNAQVHDAWTIEDYLALGHVSIQLGETPYTVFENWLLRTHAARRRIEVVAPSFSSLPTLVWGTDRVATLNRSHARLLIVGKQLKITELPFSSPRVGHALQWHRLRGGDQGIAWLADKLTAVAKGI